MVDIRSITRQGPVGVHKAMYKLSTYFTQEELDMYVDTMNEKRTLITDNYDRYRFVNLCGEALDHIVIGKGTLSKWSSENLDDYGVSVEGMNFDDIKINFGTKKLLPKYRNIREYPEPFEELFCKLHVISTYLLELSAYSGLYLHRSYSNGTGKSPDYCYPKALSSTAYAGQILHEYTKKTGKPWDSIKIKPRKIEG